MDPYQLLGLKRNATIDEVKRAYRLLARKYHPDVNSDSFAAAQFVEINKAYEYILKIINGSSHGNDVLQVEPQAFHLGQIEWHNSQEYVLQIHVEGHVRFQIAADWSTRFEGTDYDDTKSIPPWAAEISAEKLSEQVFELTFAVRGYNANDGANHGALHVVVYDEYEENVLAFTTIPVTFSTVKPTGLPVGLVDGSAILIGPLEEDQTLWITKWITNKGEPLFQNPEVNWFDETPSWAGTITVSRERGRIYPFSITFEIKTAKLDYQNSPYKAAIAIAVGGSTVGVIPVVLRVKKTPVPEIQVSPAFINIGELAWNEEKTVSFRIDNTGDQPKYSLSSRVVNTRWLSNPLIVPNDVTTFPKRLTFQTNPREVTEGDYIAVIEVDYNKADYYTATPKDAVFKQVVQVGARIGPRPNLSTNIDKIEIHAKRSQVVSREIELNNSGGYVSLVRVRWNDENDQTLEPKILNNDWPIKISVSARIPFFNARHIRNHLVISALEENGREIKTFYIPFIVTLT